ncbi:MAG: hypothetical protein JWQ23_2617 [Herminiimonas sp.]|jgi:hypothetical protein|nr:hypothetical protein [Herminiimonas sp.]
MYYEVYFRRRDGGKFDVAELERWISSLAGAFRRTDRPGDLFIVVDDAKARERWIPQYREDPHCYGDGTSIRIGENQVWLLLNGGEKVKSQVAQFVRSLLGKYDCVISDGSSDITGKIMANIDTLF